MMSAANAKLRADVERTKCVLTELKRGGNDVPLAAVTAAAAAVENAEAALRNSELEALLQHAPSEPASNTTATTNW